MYRLLSTALVLLIMQGCYYTTIDNEKCFVAPQSVHCPVSSDIENVIRKNPNKSINQVRSDIKYCANIYFSNIRELNIPQDFDNYIFILKEKGILRNDKELAYMMKKEIQREEEDKKIILIKMIEKFQMLQR